jgi:copper chaperone CopZ
LSSLLQRLLVLILAGGPLRAELMHVELSVGGLDCISCAQSVDRILKKIKGVDQASFRTQDAAAVLDLKPGNAVTLDQIRDAVKGIGYTPGVAKVTARGQAREEGGKWLFRLIGSDIEYRLEIATGQAVDTGVTSILEGSIAGPAAPLKVAKIRRE